MSLEGYAVTLRRFDGKTYEIKGALPAAHRFGHAAFAVALRLIRDNRCGGLELARVPAKAAAPQPALPKQEPAGSTIDGVGRSVYP